MNRYGLIKFALEAAKGSSKFVDTMYFEGFEILEELKKTEYRCVYLAIENDSKERVILKTLTPSGSWLRRERDLFITGARRLRRIHDPLIPQIVHQLTNLGDGRTFYAVQYRPGRPLTATDEFKLIDKDALIHSIILSVSRLHSSGLVHGDISPSNIVIDDDLSVSFIDFECVAPPETSLLSRAFARTTDRYTSPERQKDAFRLSASDDVFALGVLITDILRGDYEGNPQTTLMEVRKNPKTNYLADILARCLSDEAGGRYLNAVDLLQNLTSIRTSLKPFGQRPAIRSSPFVRSWSGRTMDGLDFSSQDLRTYDFSNANIVNCNFNNSLMTNVSFQDTRIEKCSFDGAFLILSRFLFTKIGPNTSFRDANLERTVWDDVDLANVDFRWVNFWGAFLGRARNIDTAILDNANFFRNELNDEQMSFLRKIGNKIMITGNYGTMAKEWMARNRTELVWWLEDASRPGGLLTLY